MATRLNFIALILAGVVVGLTFLIYTGASRDIGNGEIIMPLDDTYIHFQYARGMAAGHPYVYNPGDPPTSGATSFLYPYLLSIGYRLGFQGLNLGLWAMAFGAVMLLLAGWLVFLLVKGGGEPPWLAVVVMLLFLLSGPFAWHAMSGMETLLVTALTLLTLYMAVSERKVGFIVAAALLALSRPEGAIMVVIAVSVMLFKGWREGHDRRQLAWVALPVTAVGVQTLINWLMTGSPSSTGGDAKSILSMVPFYWDVAIGRILGNFARMWAEFLTDPAYLPFIVLPLALVGLISLLANPERRWLGLILLAWLVVVSGAIATLDTAFWHFKRYQIPLMALFYPLAGWGVMALWRGFLWLRQTRGTRPPDISQAARRRLSFAAVVLSALFVIFPVIANSAEYYRLYRVNLENIAAQPLPMARWLADNTPPDAVVAVHDVGMMRYLGGRYTIDMVGLTTPGAADAWRNGPGAVAEFLDSHTPQPNYVAAYTTARGLNYLADTEIYDNLLAEFRAEYDPADNVALGADYQGIYGYQRQDSQAEMVSFEQFVLLIGLSPDDPTHLILRDELNVANIAEEAAHGYTWHDDQRMTGFTTEVFEFNYKVDCFNRWFGEGVCDFRDGGRRINGAEQFTMATTPGQDAVLVTRLHPAQAGRFDVYADGEYVATRLIPEQPGHWFYVPTLIPAALITQEQTTIRIVPDVPDGHYQPYYHWLFGGEYDPDYWYTSADEESLAIWEALPEVTFQDGAFTLRADYGERFFNWSQAFQVGILVETDGTATGDYKLFIHLYDDPYAPPIAQRDSYVTGPPENWLPGVVIDNYRVDLDDLPPGVYQIAIGFYNPSTFERLTPQSDDDIIIDAGRAFIGVVTIDDE